MIESLITHNVKLSGTSVESKRKEILNYFNNTYKLYEKLFDTFVDDEVFYMQPNKLRHQLIFYFGHTAVFYINKLILGRYIQERINPNYESMFAIGVDEMSWDDLNQAHYDWPKVDEVRAYRNEVKKVVQNYIQNVDFALPITWESPMWVVLMGIEHERIHIETSSVLHRELEAKYIKPNSFRIECDFDTTAPINQLQNVPSSKITLGKADSDGEYYGWDNEYGIQEHKIEAFKASKYLVSNHEFMQFVNDGGYENDQFWSVEGKKWKAYTNAKHPYFWIATKNGYDLRTPTNQIPLPLSWPVETNFLEAQAFCNYLSKKLNKNITLPTEAMWHALAKFCKIEDENTEANINLECFGSPCPVNTFEQSNFFDVIGNVWQWTNTTIDQFDGFKIHPLYDDFSVPTFDGRHNIIKGGSFISTGNEALMHSRYAFRRHFPQHAGFRYIEVEKLDQNSVVKKEIQLPQKINPIHKSVIDKLLPNIKKRSKMICLGCKTGSIAAYVAQHFEKVVATDFTASNIQIAQNNFPISNIRFLQADSCNLKSHFCDYDLILVTNPLIELYNLKQFLEDIPTRLNPGGQLILLIDGLKEEDKTLVQETLSKQLTRFNTCMWVKDA